LARFYGWQYLSDKCTLIRSLWYTMSSSELDADATGQQQQWQESELQHAADSKYDLYKTYTEKYLPW